MIAPEKGRPYWNPYVAGAALGVLVTVAFAAGHYFGASRVFATLAAWLRGDGVSLRHWMSFEMVGVLVGALGGSLLARRFRPAFTRGPRLAAAGTGGIVLRSVMALVGGALVMLGSRFAAGCTSGLALTGGIGMSAGAYVFMAAMFIGGFGAAAVARRLWT